MGGQQSGPALDDLPPLPQQQVADLTWSQDGAPAGLNRVQYVGSETQTRRMTVPLSFFPGSIRLHGSGIVTADVKAMGPGVLQLFAPAILMPGAEPEEETHVAWPTVSVESGTSWQRTITPSDRQTICFDDPKEALDATYMEYWKQCRSPAILEDGRERWPLALLLQSGESVADGQMLACCAVDREGRLSVARQYIAMGNGRAQLIRSLFGISDASKATAAVNDGSAADETPDGQANCVVCLTAPKDTALLPCGHFCVCNECGRSIRLSPARNRCPLCRQEVYDIVLIKVDGTAVAGTDADVSHASSMPVPDPQDGRATGSTASMPLNSSSTGMALPPRCLQRLTRELRAVEQQRQQHLHDHGVEIGLFDEEGEDLRLWRLRLHSRAIDAQCRLGSQLQAHGVASIDIEVWIPDGFPMEPPKMRILSPIFREGHFFVQAHGALCLELLTKQGWVPSTTLPQLAVQVKTMMASAGSGDIVRAGELNSNREAAWRVQELVDQGHTDWKKVEGW